MNMTTEIFRKAVIVTMINGNSPRAVMKMIMPTVLGASFIAGKAHDSDTEAVPDLHQRAAAQPPAVGHGCGGLRRRGGPAAPARRAPAAGAHRAKARHGRLRRRAAPA